MAQALFKSNVSAVLRAEQAAIKRAAETIGGIAESYAKQYLTDQGAVDTGNLRNSVTHTTENDGHVVVIGTSVEYAPYVELGTGKFAEGGKGRQTPWSYQDSSGNWHTTQGMKARPYLRPALENHLSLYVSVLKGELSGSPVSSVKITK